MNESSKNELAQLKRHCELTERRNSLNKMLNGELESSSAYVRRNCTEPSFRSDYASGRGEDIFPELEKAYTSAFIMFIIFAFLLGGVIFLAITLKNSNIVILKDCWLVVLVFGIPAFGGCAIWKFTSMKSIRGDKTKFQSQWDEYQRNVSKAKSEYPTKKFDCQKELMDVEDELKITVKTAEKVEKIFSDAGLDVNLKKVIERMEEEGISLTKASNELVKEKLEEIEAEWEYQREYALCLSCTKFKRCVMSPKDECAAYWPK